MDQPIHIIDWYPTLINLAGGKLEQKLPFDGKNLWPVHPRRESPHDAILLSGASVGNGGTAVRAGDWKLISEVAGS